MRRIAAALVGALLAGCAGGRSAPAPDAIVLPEPALATRGLVVSLVWAGPADLDLFVTDPAGVTVSADRPAGVLAADVGCEELARGVEAVETARWPAPVRGRYQVGVGFPVACGDAEQVPYRVIVDVAGRRRTFSGTAAPLQRAPSAVEFHVP